MEYLLAGLGGVGKGAGPGTGSKEKDAGERQELKESQSVPRTSANLSAKLCSLVVCYRRVKTKTHRFSQPRLPYKAEAITLLVLCKLLFMIN